MSEIIPYVGYAIYAVLAVIAVWGMYNTILLSRGIKKVSIGSDAETLLGQVRELLKANRPDAAIEIVQQPPHWKTALAQLIGVALKYRKRSVAKIKQILVMEFHTEVIAGLENRLATISTIVRMGPLLGLLGTVVSMIGAFGRISTTADDGKTVNVEPAALAGDISIGLLTTAAGLIIATPFMIVGNNMHAKLKGLRDQTERQLQEVLEVLEVYSMANGSTSARRTSASTQAR